MRRSPRTAIQAPASAAGSVAQMSAAFVGGDTQQDGYAAAISEVSVTGGVGPYTYATALQDPRGVDRAALLTGPTTATPSFTPDITGGAGCWILRSTVTDSDGREVSTTKTVTVGQSVDAGPNWAQVYSYVSNGSDTANPSAGTLLFGGLTWTIVNADAASGPKVDGGDLSITPNAAAQLTGSAITNVAALRISLNSLTGLSTVGTRRIMMCLELEDYTPTTSDEGFIVGLELAGAGFGAGASSRAVGAGQGVSAASIRSSRTVGQGSATLRSAYSTATGTPCRSFAVILCQAGAMAYSSTTAGALDTATEVIAASIRNAGGAEAAVDLGAYNQVIIAAQKPVVGAAGAEFRLKELRVFVC